MTRPDSSLLSAALALAAGLALASPAEAQSGGGQRSGTKLPHIRAEVRYWSIEWSGDLDADAGGVAGTSLDAHHDLDLDNELHGIEALVTLGDFDAGWIAYQYFRTAARGEFFLQRNLTYRGVNFPQDSRVFSRVDLSYSALTLGQVYGTGQGYFLGVEIGAGEYHWRSRIRAPEVGTGTGTETRHASVDEDPTLPIFGVVLVFGLGEGIRFYGTARGNFFAFRSNDSELIEGYGELRIPFGSWLTVNLGWRYFSLDATFRLNSTDNARVDVFFHGPFIGVEVRI
ncbi:MAG: hypothetical protein L0216_17095 [Planctomycetales bacterium]|nr:hypothetical protein [Planctomycetales bacterium]